MSSPEDIITESRQRRFGAVGPGGDVSYTENSTGRDRGPFGLGPRTAENTRDGTRDHAIQGMSRGPQMPHHYLTVTPARRPDVVPA